MLASKIFDTVLAIMVKGVLQPRLRLRAWQKLGARSLDLKALY